MCVCVSLLLFLAPPAASRPCRVLPTAPSAPPARRRPDLLAAAAKLGLAEPRQGSGSPAKAGRPAHPSSRASPSSPSSGRHRRGIVGNHTSCVCVLVYGVGWSVLPAVEGLLPRVRGVMCCPAFGGSCSGGLCSPALGRQPTGCLLAGFAVGFGSGCCGRPPTGSHGHEVR